MKSYVTHFNIHSRQRGAVLFVALVLLLVLTIIAIAGMQTTTLQETMAGNMRDKNLAFQAAEAALRDCEATLEQVVLPGISAANGFYRSTDFSGGSTDPVWQTVAWDADDSREYGVGDTQELTRVAADPRCIIVELPPVKLLGGSLSSDTPADDIIYQVTARAVGGSANTIVMLQTTFKR